MKINMKCPNCITCNFRKEIEVKYPHNGGFILTYTISCLAPNPSADNLHKCPLDYGTSNS